MGFFNHIRVLFQSRVGARGSPRQPRVTNTAGTEYKLRVSCSLNEKSGFAPGTTNIGERSGCVTIKSEPRWSGDSSDKDGSDDHQLEKQQWKNKHQCRFCPYSSSYSPNVTRHEKQHTGRKPFSCRYCRRSFSQKAALENHEKLHTSDKPFRCRTCYKAFKLRTSLVRHERIHTGERQSRCSTCGKTFRDTTDLIRHEGSHRGDRQYRCEICGKGYSKIPYLNDHRERCHGDNASLPQKAETSRGEDGNMNKRGNMS
ncbi:zinc finger protein 135 [Ixodes scapularis]|uniref:zinc finger protein 135 n=1 Tax=Ixodes scapularis TaxID=6945 RepID=UPI001A9F6CA7|nr:zinc finger protein 135 [Ixodes scapularis]